MASGRPDWMYASEVNIYKQDISVLSTRDDCSIQRGVDIQDQSASSLVTDDQATNTRDIDVIAQSIGNIGTEDSCINVREIDIVSQALSYVSQWGKQGSPHKSENLDALTDTNGETKKTTVSGEGLIWGGRIEIWDCTSGDIEPHEVFVNIDGNEIENISIEDLHNFGTDGMAGDILFIKHWDDSNNYFNIGLAGSLYFESSVEFGYTNRSGDYTKAHIYLFHTII